MRSGTRENVDEYYILPRICELNLLPNAKENLILAPFLHTQPYKIDNPDSSDSERSSSPLMVDLCESEVDEKASNKRTLPIEEGKFQFLHLIL